ncbi:MAG: RtcB family protein [Egibacteraceae bacterium]
MPPKEIAPRVLSWASLLDEEAARQAATTARLPVVRGHVALMPDAHLGKGVAIGSVIPTKGALIPSAVGVDIGCGMTAAETDVTADDLPDTLEPLLDRIGQSVPAGMDTRRSRGTSQTGQDHDRCEAGVAWLKRALHQPSTQLTPEQLRKVGEQFGTLGSGNHFLEVCVDERDRVWVVLHSGSRGIGNQLAQRHITSAKGLMRQLDVALEDPELAYVLAGTPEFDAYVADLRFAQGYAKANRAQMMAAALADLIAEVGRGRQTRRIDCHHNYAVVEHHFGEDVWVTRKGAIRARAGDLGIVPGSMGTTTYIVQGLGETQSYASCAHGAGRAMSRRQARQRFTEDDLLAAMGDRTWLRHSAKRLLDEIPGSYKDVTTVMADQRDLVEPLHTLHGVLSYKGT